MDWGWQLQAWGAAAATAAACGCCCCCCSPGTAGTAATSLPGADVPPRGLVGPAPAHPRLLALHALLPQPLLVLLCVLSLRLQGLLELPLLPGRPVELLKAVTRGLACVGRGGAMLLQQASLVAHVLDF